MRTARLFLFDAPRGCGLYHVYQWCTPRQHGRGVSGHGIDRNGI